MVGTLEGIRVGGGSIRVGTTGTIGALVSRELDSIKPVLQTPSSSRTKTNAAPANRAPIRNAGSNTGSTRNAMKSRPQLNAANSSRNKGTDSKPREIIPKAKQYNRKSNQIPMLNSENISIDGTPIRQKPEKRLSYMVGVVDIKCGSPERAWVSPITNRLRKLGFSKLSESII